MGRLLYANWCFNQQRIGQRRHGLRSRRAHKKASRKWKKKKAKTRSLSTNKKKPNAFAELLCSLLRAHPQNVCARNPLRVVFTPKDSLFSWRGTYYALTVERSQVPPNLFKLFWMHVNHICDSYLSFPSTFSQARNFTSKSYASIPIPIVVDQNLSGSDFCAPHPLPVPLLTNKQHRRAICVRHLFPLASRENRFHQRTSSFSSPLGFQHLTSVTTFYIRFYIRFMRQTRP
jgi:hypothetical protein